MLYLFTLHKDLCTYVVISHWILLRINISDKGCTENQHTFFVRHFFPSFLKSFRLWHNMENYGAIGLFTDDYIIRSTRNACWITNARDSHSEYVVLIAFPQQHWLCERALMLCYTYMVSFVLNTAELKYGILFFYYRPTTLRHGIPTFRGKIMFLSSGVGKT